MNLRPRPSITGAEMTGQQWEECWHKFKRYFGPCMRCEYCGAETMVTMDPRESKPIYPPSVYTDKESK
jgi:hypothetical protein